jgi:glycosyltransferase involved in cell wall biosynthesis
MSAHMHSTTSGEPPAGRRVVVVTPARNEAALLPGVVASMVRQTLRPARWVIVDDGSTDGTAEIAEAAASQHDWIRVVYRTDRGRRVLGSGVIESFDRGLAEADAPHEFVGKMDADLTFGPRYLERAMERFEAEPALGALSGKVFRPEGERDVEEFMIDEMVAGQWKLYRRTCFDEIGGFVREVMWDGIDFHQARRRGWRTRSVQDEDLRIRHHRLMGSSDRSVLVGRLRWGRGQWFLGSHPLYVAAASVFRMLERPRVLGGALILAGFVQAWLRGESRYADAGFRTDLRRWQLRRLGRLTGGHVR